MFRCAKTVRAKFLGGVALLAMSAAGAYAQAASINLPEQDLSHSLNDVSQRTGENILFLQNIVEGVRAPAISGQMTAKQAIDKLLRGTSLRASPDGRGGIVIERQSFVSPVAPERPRIVVAQATAGTPSNPPPAPPEPQVEQVVVSASRITIAGYQQPTPVTVVGAAEIQHAANADIGDTIRDLPAVGLSSSPLKGGGGGSVFDPTAGASTINLRNLGIDRTLVLFDGQRVVASNVSGGVDLSTIPSMLVKRIDVVTGGASAAWGSDAVAGVVNLVLDKTFTGFKANIEGGDNGWDNHRSYGLDAALGFDFAGGRGHFIVAGASHYSPDTVHYTDAKWWNSTYLLPNPAYAPGNGQPKVLHYSNAGNRETQGGAILEGPLAGTQFVGPNGTPVPYNPGVYAGPIAAGGSSNPYNSIIPKSTLAYPYRTKTLFAYGSYKLTPEIVASAQFNYGYAWSKNTSTPLNTRSFVIHDDNAYLDPSIKAQMAALGITQFNLATTQTNNVDMHDPTWAQLGRSVTIPVNTVNRQLYRGVFSLDGALGSDWSWNAYYQHGQSRIHSVVIHDSIRSRVALAGDAVRVTAANVGASGLPIGSIACRSTLSDPANGCQPLNVFGEGVASQAAVDYINTDQNYQIMVLNEDVLSASMQGQLPWDLAGAGAPSVAFGVEHRKEAGNSDISPLAAAKMLTVGNFGKLHGHYTVTEGFLESDVPLIKDGVVDSLTLNAAGRITDYSTSGMVETWKLGLVSQLNQDIRLRGTWSYDIRAPNLAELFNEGLTEQGSPIDPRTGQAVVSYITQGGNLDLKPEKSVTISGGVVLTPRWFPGLQMSVDWYSINVKGYITTPSLNTESALCRDGNQFYCSQFHYDANGVLQTIIQFPQNAGYLKTSGIDFQANYTMDFLSGALSWNLLGNYTDAEVQSAFDAPPYDFAGQVGGSSSGYSGMPKFRTTLSATYVQGPLSATVQGRFIGSARNENLWVSGVDVDDNSVPGVAYLDLRGSYQWTDNIQIYGAIDNVTNVPPPAVPPLGNSDVPGQNPGTAAAIYDILGRTIRVGVRLSY
jgi:outer membrane receptor protein involved in Fe transport